MNRLRLKRGVSAQLMAAVLASLLAAAAAFFAVYFAGNVLLEKTVYGKSFISSMSDKQFAQLEDYVLEEKVTPDYLRPLDIWCSRGDRVYLSIYIGDAIIYESQLTSKIRPQVSAYHPELEDPEQEYELTLSDGTQTRTFLYYYAGDAYYYWVIAAASLTAFVVFSLLFIALVHRKLRYIKLMKAELDILAGGDLSYEVTIKGVDELSELARGIDEMRRSILEHQRAEDEMRQANSALVTAMSHDLRTPLTSLLAYLELMERGKYEDEAQLRHFIERSLEKTLRIKDMADKLFEYFLVYSSEWERPMTEQLDAQSLVEQCWGEYAFALESHGFKVSHELEPLSAKLRADPALLRRAFDNLCSNLLKYADPAEEIRLGCRREGDGLLLTVENRISPNRDKRESTNIGLNTCARIIRYHGGEFEADERDGEFRISIHLPLEELEEV